MSAFLSGVLTFGTLLIIKGLTGHNVGWEEAVGVGLVSSFIAFVAVALVQK